MTRAAVRRYGIDDQVEVDPGALEAVVGEISSARPSSYERKQNSHTGREGEGEGGREVICIRSITPVSRYLSASVHAFETEKCEEGLLLFSQAQRRDIEHPIWH